MKNICLFMAFMFLFAEHTIHAQDMNPPERSDYPRIGFGVSVVDIKEVFQIISNSDDVAPTVYIPINISDRLRIEPEIGFYSAFFEEKKTDSGWAERTSETSKFFHIGLGILTINDMGNYLVCYGIRAGYLGSSSKWDYNWGKDKSNSYGFYISPIIGGEYNISSHFSLGGELQVRFTNIDGDEKTYMSPTMNTDVYATSLSTRTLIMSRFYF